MNPSRHVRRSRLLALALSAGLSLVGAGTAAAADDPAPRPPDGHRHAAAGPAAAHHHGSGATIVSPAGQQPTPFDLVRTSVRRVGDHLVFTERVRGRAGSLQPAPTGRFAGSEVLSYVWPTSLDPSTVGFQRDTGILALAATSHPDFDDTPRADENGDGDPANDGLLWHAHWVVLVPDTTRPDGALKVRDIAEGEQPELPGTWPGIPLFLDSPDYRTTLRGHQVSVRVPLEELGFPSGFRFDGVTAALRVAADLHDPLLRVESPFDVASGDLTLPGEIRLRP